MKKKMNGINIQWPISELILEGKKTIETRTYPIPPEYLGTEVVLIETPGKKGGFKARMRAIIKFTNCFQYQSQSEFYKDSNRHQVNPDSEWAYDPCKPKWGWEVDVIQLFSEPLPLQKRSGIKFSRDITIDC